jgi:hypothetical protein
MILKQQRTNKLSTKQTTSVNQEPIITPSQLSQLSMEELEKVTGSGVGGEGTGGVVT